MPKPRLSKGNRTAHRSVEGDELREAMGTFVTGVTVVTAGRPQPHGMTLNAMTSVSLNPAQVLICIGTQSRMCTTVLEDNAFTVSILKSQMVEAAKLFSSPSRPYGAENFTAFDTWPGPTFGHPIFANSLAWLECQVTSAQESGDHTMFTGLVCSCGSTSGQSPLLFQDGSLTSWPRETSSA